MSFKEQIMSKDKKISKRIFAPNGDYCVSHPSNIFCDTHGFEYQGISLGYSPVFA